MVARRGKPPPSKLPSGSKVLDLVLGGGWALGRIVNIVGDRSSGKTLLAIEACGNFMAVFRDPERIRYRETEAAFDVEYAKSVGFPSVLTDSLQEPALRTVEEFYNDLNAFLDKLPDDQPAMYVLDSLDALSDEAEAGRGFGQATYGTGKAKAMSELFRRLAVKIEKKKCVVIIISQIRDKLNVTFGETKTRAGGRALDFYASQIVWLAETSKIKRQVSRAERVVGVNVLARCRKNKVGMPFRECDLSVLFSYGVDDEASCLNWLKKNHGEDSLTMPVKEITAALALARTGRNTQEIMRLRGLLHDAVAARWDEIETALRPPMKKYETA